MPLDVSFSGSNNNSPCFLVSFLVLGRALIFIKKEKNRSFLKINGQIRMSGRCDGWRTKSQSCREVGGLRKGCSVGKGESGKEELAEE